MSKTESVRDWARYRFQLYESVLKVVYQKRNKKTTSDYIINYGYFRKIIGYDDVIFFGYSYSTYILSAIFRKCFFRNNSLFCESTINEGAKNNLVMIVKKAIIRFLFDRYFVPGEESKKYLLSLGINEGKIDIAVNSSELRPQTKITIDNANKTDEVVRLIYVGRFAEEKNLVQMICALKQATINFHLTLIGSGPLSEDVNKLVDNDSRFSNLGHLEPEMLKKVYLDNDILILPSKKEPWGLVVNEAINFGLAVLVSSSVGCRFELVKDNGRVFKVDDYEDMLLKLDEIIENLYDCRRASLIISKDITSKDQAKSFLTRY
ncbi:glycosyltransferase family 4 protein [Vibrio sp. B1FLJ16]|uniref:glycosyltransferase family 4 protein n=1 Tax=Vibrio sp. B1FLJ16 TaxID=2751178 RepID=UPI001BA7B785|nr:glycosyltransferase family 4 protein [Vibrio sp. B1FLJ16]